MSNCASQNVESKPYFFVCHDLKIINRLQRPTIGAHALNMCHSQTCTLDIRLLNCGHYWPRYGV